jgi:hypothetical protein
MLIAKRAIVRGHANTVAWVLARLHSVDQVTNRERVFLRRAKNKGLLALIDRFHEQSHAVFFALLDLDDAIEISFDVTPAFLGDAFDQLVIGGVDVIIERGGDLLDLEGGQIPSLIPSFRE